MGAPLPNRDEIKSAGLLGMLGIIFQLLSGIPDVGPLLAIAGLIMWLIAMKKLADAYGNQPIFRNALVAVVLGFVLAVVLFIALFVGLISLTSFVPMHSGFSPMWGVIGIIIAVLVVLWIVMIVEAYFIRKAYLELARSSGVADFESAAKWYWIGALTVIVLVGLVFVLVGDVFAILGFNK
ncbi:MAG: DUF996 domain-containing protein, partial [Thermoproteus sp.]